MRCGFPRRVLWSRTYPQAIYHIPLDRAPAVAPGRPLPEADSSYRAHPEFDTGRVEPERETHWDCVNPKTKRFRGEKNKPNRYSTAHEVVHTPFLRRITVGCSGMSYDRAILTHANSGGGDGKRLQCRSHTIQLNFDDAQKIQ